MNRHWAISHEGSSDACGAGGLRTIDVESQTPLCRRTYVKVKKRESEVEAAEHT